jgi:predicted secreted hydrolase
MSLVSRLPSILAGLALAGIVLLIVLRFQTDEHGPPEAPALRLELASLLGGADSAGFAHADEVRPFSFPADHGPHPEYRSEWWYFTGNLQDPKGRHFGYQWTLFRFALQPDFPASRSAWAARDVYMGHFTITDVSGESFHTDERLARGVLDMAGVQAAPFRAWIDDWSVKEGTLPGVWELRAASQAVAIRLELAASGPVVLQGEQGLSRKNARPGNASYYYSMPRLDTRGTLTLNGESIALEGKSWLDREWSSSALEDNQIGWDWFGLQFSDETELMVYRMRRSDGTNDPYSNGVFIDQQGQPLRLRAEDVDITVLDTWVSPRGVRYPSRWDVHVKPLSLRLDITPLLENQELNLSVRYWEGAVRISGMQGQQPVTGYGYAELTGYD